MASAAPAPRGGALPRLIVLPPSHYCERARWGLDRAGVAHAEEAWAVGPHLPLGRRRHGGSALPALVLPDGAVVRGSGAILDWAGLPAADAALEEHFDRRVGVLVRQFIYAGTLGDPRANIRALLLDDVPGAQGLAGRALWPATRRLMRAAMNARPELLPALEREVGAELDALAARLAGRDHLVGAAFTRADLTAASLLAPLARPGVLPIYARARLGRIEPAVARWAKHPAMAWVRRTYAAHRGPSAALAA